MVLVFLANGFEETEAVAPIDILRRNGQNVITVGIGEEVITSSHGITVVPDVTEADMSLMTEIDMIVLPGGMPGTLNLEKSRTVQDTIDYCAANGKFIGAICAAPSILGKKGLLKGKKATCFPGFEEFLEGADFTGEPVEKDGNIITARGAGVAVEFGLKLVEALSGKPASDKIRESMRCV
ncbi:MAG TPA: DJ-1 family protein [Ruminococcaceae bacterium]|nr:DJ-1 family protein [Oscillospiraceae bacterium]